MNMPFRNLAVWIVILMIAGMTAVAGTAPYALRHSLFDPGTNALAHAWFGGSVRISGDLVAVSQVWDGVSATNSGVVRIYSANSGALLNTITNPSPKAYDYFGGPMAISGTKLILGAYSDGTGIIPSGIIRAYDLAGATPTVPMVTLTNPVPRPDGVFARPIAISGSRVVAGANWDNETILHVGLAHIFDLNSLTPTVPVLTLTNPAPEEPAYFGSAVAISGNRVAVGAVGAEPGFQSSGAVYVYDLDGDSPSMPLFKISHIDLGESIGIGFRLALDNSLLVVDTLLVQCGTHEDDKVYVYDLAASQPSLPALTLSNLHPCPGAVNGHSIAVSNNRLVIGAHQYETGNTNGGVVYVFDPCALNPSVPIAVLPNPTPMLDDAFGSFVAIDGTVIVVGAVRDNTRATDSGAAYVYTVGPTLRTVPSAPGFIALSWTPTNAPGFVLQYSDDLSPTNWGNAPSGATNPVTVPMTNTARFYRLAQP